MLPGELPVAEGVGGIESEYYQRLKGSAALFQQACEIFPGGVTHDLRGYSPFPLYAKRAVAGRKWDVDGREYVDLWMGHGALLLGHCYPSMVEAVARQVAVGTHFGAGHELELEWGSWVQRLIPSAERVRFTSSGTEATLMALRLARTYTGRRKVVKFFGHFHGWHDNLTIGVNPPFDEPVPPGILQEVADTVLLCPPNDSQRLEEILKQNKDVACVILEPTGGSFGTIPSRPGFLQEVRELTQKYDVLLIFDEVITGFRCAPGGAQAHYGILPDLTTLAKILSGGLPGGCLVGRQDILELLAFHPDKEWNHCRKMPHQGTFNANPISAAAGIATLEAVASGKVNEQANRNGQILRDSLNRVLSDRNLNWVVYGEFSGIKFLRGCEDREITLQEMQDGTCDYRKPKAPDPRLRDAFRAAMQLEGVDLMGLTGLVASVHTQEDLDFTVSAFDRALDRLENENFI